MKTWIPLIVATLAALGLAWFDTAEYRALAAHHQGMAREPQAQVASLAQQDAQRYQRCDALRAENRARNTIDFTPEGRRCLIDALDQAGSVAGTLVLLRNASVVLLKDPQDQPVRAAALAALERAREVLGRQQAWQHDAPARLAQARAASLLMRLQPVPPQETSFVRQALALDQAEVGILLPQLHQSQQIGWLERRWPLSAPL